MNGVVATNCQLSDHVREICSSTDTIEPKERQRKKDKGLVKGGTEGNGNVDPRGSREFPHFIPCNRETETNVRSSTVLSKAWLIGCERRRDAMASRAGKSR